MTVAGNVSADPAGLHGPVTSNRHRGRQHCLIDSRAPNAEEPKTSGALGLSRSEKRTA